MISKISCYSLIAFVVTICSATTVDFCSTVVFSSERISLSDGISNWSTTLYNEGPKIISSLTIKAKKPDTIQSLENLELKEEGRYKLPSTVTEIVVDGELEFTYTKTGSAAIEFEVIGMSCKTVAASTTTTTASSSSSTTTGSTSTTTGSTCSTSAMTVTQNLRTSWFSDDETYLLYDVTFTNNGATQISQPSFSLSFPEAGGHYASINQMWGITHVSGETFETLEIFQTLSGVVVNPGETYTGVGYIMATFIEGYFPVIAYSC